MIRPDNNAAALIDREGNSKGAPEFDDAAWELDN